MFPFWFYLPITRVVYSVSSWSEPILEHEKNILNKL